jgi:hypothetical protein
VVFGLWGPGDAVGGMLSHITLYYIESLTPVEGTLFSPDDKTAIAQFTRLYLQQVEALIVIRSNKNIDMRLIRLLSWIFHQFGEDNAQGNLINLRLTHQDLAELLAIKIYVYGSIRISDPSARSVKTYSRPSAPWRTSLTR